MNPTTIAINFKESKTEKKECSIAKFARIRAENNHKRNEKKKKIKVEVLALMLHKDFLQKQANFCNTQVSLYIYFMFSFLED